MVPTVLMLAQRRRNRKSTKAKPVIQACQSVTPTLTMLVPALLLGADAEVRTLEGHRGSVMAVAFSPDGNVLASSSRDQTIKPRGGE